MVAKIKFSQPSHYDIYITATPQQSQGGCGYFLAQIFIPKNNQFRRWFGVWRSRI